MVIKLKLGNFNIKVNIPIDEEAEMPWSLHQLVTVRRYHDNDIEIISAGEEEITNAIKSNLPFLKRLSNRTGITKEELEMAVKRLIAGVINSSSVFNYGKKSKAVVIEGFSPDDKDLDELAKVVDLTFANGDNMFVKGCLKTRHPWADVYLNIPFRRHMSLNRFNIMRGLEDYLEFVNPEPPIVLDPDQEKIKLVPSVNIFRIRSSIPGTEEGSCIISKSCANKLKVVKHYCTTNYSKYVPSKKVEKETIIGKQEIELYKGDKIWKCMVGDKLIDAHSNKCIVSEIVDDHEMPVINGKRVEMIFNPNINKRCNFSAIIEERLSNSELPPPIICKNYKDVLNCPNFTYVKFRGQEYHADYGTTKFYRPDQIAAEKFNTGLLNLGDAWLRFYAGDKDLLRKMLNRSSQAVAFETLKQTLNALSFVKTNKGLEHTNANPKVTDHSYRLTKKLDRLRIGIGFTEPQPETVLDPITEQMETFIEYNGKIISMPARPFVVMDGLIIVDNIRAAFNRIIAESQSIEKSQMPRYIFEYQRLLEASLKGKNGAIYNTIYPKIQAIYGVAYNARVDRDTILLPRSCMSAEAEQYATVIRMPSHGIHNIKFMRVKYIDTPAKAIGINHETMKSMDGDFDGDCLIVIRHPKDEADILIREAENNSRIFSATYNEIQAPVPIDKEPFIRGLTDEEIIAGQINAAKKYKNIKTLTAMGSAIAIKLRDNALCRKLDLNTYFLYGRMYHYIAQSALEEKHNVNGRKSPIEIFVRSYPRDMNNVFKVLPLIFQGDAEVEEAFKRDIVLPAKITLLQAMKYRSDLRSIVIQRDTIMDLIWKFNEENEENEEEEQNESASN